MEEIGVHAFHNHDFMWHTFSSVLWSSALSLISFLKGERHKATQPQIKDAVNCYVLWSSTFTTLWILKKTKHIQLNYCRQVKWFHSNYSDFGCRETILPEDHLRISSMVYSHNKNKIIKNPTLISILVYIHFKKKLKVVFKGPIFYQFSDVLYHLGLQGCSFTW